ncbi:MAG: uroporphyrinogen decarboxylase family protein [Victivallaceae bacterium]|nr:uroporphyrinogen decarboxylase family protein [Victivallaceae bacterium]
MKNPQIPFTLAIPPEVLCEKAGIELHDYYCVPAKRLETHQRARDYFWRTFSHDIGKSVGSGITSYWCAAVLGAEIEFTGNNQAVVHERVLKSAEDIRKLVPPSPQDIPNLPRYRFLAAQHAQMARLVKGTGFEAPFGIFGFQGPFTTATILRGTEIMMDIVLHPELIKELLEKIVEAQCNVMVFSGKEFGITRKTCGMGDDYAGLISPEMYGEFCYPYMKTLYDAYGIEYRSLHCETLKRGHHKYLNMLEIDSYDPGVNKDLSIEDILEDCPGMFFTYNLFTVSDMVNKTPAAVKGLCKDYIRRGAPGIMAEITVKTPEGNISAFLETMREYEPPGKKERPEDLLPRD